MRRIAIVMLLILIMAPGSEAGIRLGLGGGWSTLTGGDSAKFPLQGNYSGVLRYDWPGPYSWEISLRTYSLSDDSSATSSFSRERNELFALNKWTAARLGWQMRREMLRLGKRINLNLGVGGGLMIWKVSDPVTDTTFSVTGAHSEKVDYAATELFLSTEGSVSFSISPSWSLEFVTGVDYLTEAGAEFGKEINTARDRWIVNAGFVLSIGLGKKSREVWPSEENWSRTQDVPSVHQTLDSDDDGIPDITDRCMNTPRGAIVDRFGCPIDSDADGVSDGLDDCPGTDIRARGKVDIYGCPIDSDYDAIPDYLDSCAFNRLGAIVDQTGCPIDSDGDGVPDGIDDCPNTLYGVDVDGKGCIDLAMLAEPMVLNIDYAPGSFEVDPRSRERLESLARLLNFVPDIRLDVSGYSDNIGTSTANRNLSEKRARRVRDFLVTLGIATERIKAIGKGETDFVASNQTSAGRAKNRRIVITFYK